jgi:hypothetical protein
MTMRGMGRVCGAGEDAEFDNCITQDLRYGGGGASGGGGNNWGKFWQDILREGVSITRAVVTPPAVRRNADGSLQIRSSTPPATFPGGAGVGVGIPGWVWLAGGGALLLVALSNRRNQ